ncbi:hypothetical protein C0V70_17130 [Bacteriovorax stolpii]|uniref:Uncharacterized protein n=1 Tax=Bacteriovorax stolpii TaxID=960 RepID=A0A2K9NWB1_BACTC|nr:hypothetical protein [Bacteriovorax stolpii]AUN99796.1 hypothetical protein C0V70_17130 [Bacteriovorax stolpii]TDP54314.1 hypothetical protein C8D79_1609 [Bacteriovorax stolpii]
MISLRKIICFMCLAPAVSMATPKKIEMIFLSPKKVSMILELLDKKQSISMSSHLAQNDDSHCVPMGDGCFHPQLGYIEKKVEAPPSAEAAKEAAEDKKAELKTFNALETSLVNCDKNNYFDIFCGKEKGDAPPAEIEIWFDISSSLKSVDYNREPDRCARRSFMEAVIKGCKSKVRASVYNTSIKEVGDFSSVCMSYGTNDQKRLLSWMKDSKAKHLLIVTDIDEMSVEMREFLGSNGAKMTGDGVKAFTSDDLVDYAKDFTKMCR